MDVWSLIRVLVKHHCHQVGHLIGIVARERGILTLANPNGELVKG